MNKVIMWVVIAVVVIGGGYWVWSAQKMQAPQEENTNVNENIPPSENAPVANENTSVPPVQNEDPSVPPQAGTKTFAVTGTSDFKFSVGEMRVKKGDRVTIVFTNAGGMHDWKVDEFNAATKVLKAGEVETISFVASKTGSFEYYCSVGNHRAMGMKGTLIVE